MGSTSKKGKTNFDARRAVQMLYHQHGSWRAVAETIGCMSASYWCHVAERGLKPSPTALRALKRRVGAIRLIDLPVAELRRMLSEREDV